MILNWSDFIGEDVNIKGLKKAIKKQEMFKEIHIDLKSRGKSIKATIEAVAKELGIEGKVKAFQSGAFGITFLAGDKTIKITTNDEEASMVAKIMKFQKRKNLDHIVRYDNIFRLSCEEFNKGYGNNYYVIVMERITPLYLKQEPLEFYEEFLEDKFDKYADNHKRMMDVGDTISQKIRKTKFKKYESFIWDMIQIVEQYYVIGLKNTDMHSGNMGINSKGSLISFDPMGSVSKKPRIKKLNL